MVNRGQDDVEREHEQERIEIPDVIDVEPAELAIEQLLRRRQFGEVFIEALHRLLHDEHPDHAADDEQHEQCDAEAHGAE